LANAVTYVDPLRYFMAEVRSKHLASFLSQNAACATLAHLRHPQLKGASS
jgi:hypothetical protein